MLAKQVLLCGVVVSALAVADVSAAQSVAVGPQAAATPEATSDGGDLIIVTGSRIRRDPLNQDSPVVVLDQEAVARTGLSAIADVLQRLPSAAGGLNTKTNNSGNIGSPADGGGVGAGSAEIDLRYLGAKRTLVLVDGQRFVNGSSASGIPASVDLNTIPASSIERIEVLQSGQSPLYGSDAIAGVVNIITKSVQEGLQASAQFGTFRQGDGHTQDYNASYGIKLPTTNIVFGGSYVKQQAVRAKDRSTSQFDQPGATSCLQADCSGATPLGQFAFNPGSSIASGADFTLKNAVNGKPRFDPANPTGPNSDFKDFETSDRFNFQPFNYFLTPSERYGAFISVKQELGSNVNLRIKAQYNRRNSQNQAAFLPVYFGPDNATGVLAAVSIDATNPYNPFGQTLSPGGAGNPSQNYSFIGRRLVEAGQRTYTQRVDTMSLNATLDGSFLIGEHKWFWDVNAVLGFNDAHQSFTGNINAAKLTQALGPLSACTAPCVPLNVFGGVGSITPDQLAFIGFTEKDRSTQRLNDYTANLSGDLFTLPAGPVGLAIGYEHRDQKGTYNPDPIIVAGLGADIPSLPASGRFNSDEVYGEIRVPILAKVPFFYSLEVDGAVRHSDYSISGGNTTYTGSALWKPVEDLLFRGSYAQGFRAPSIGELFGSASRSDTPGHDPCTDINGTGTGSGLGVPASPTVRANCIANGVPADGSFRQPDGQLPVITGGNTELKPEKSRTLLFGAVLSPRWARDTGFASMLSIEGNYYDIKLDNAISSIAASVLLDRCANTGDALSCSAITRTPNGFITQIDGILQNIGGIRTKGVDLTFTYRTPSTPAGVFGLSLNGNYLLKYSETVPATTGFTVINRRGTERGIPNQAFPKFKGTGTLDWSLGDVIASFTGRFIEHVTEDQADNRLGNIFYGDVQLGYSPSAFDRRMTLTVGVNNVFNKNPPPCFSCDLNNYDSSTYDVPGQFGYVRLSYKL